MEPKRLPAVMRRIAWLATAIIFSACSDDPTGPSAVPPDMPSPAVGMGDLQEHIGVFGVLEEMRGPILVLRQDAPRFEPDARQAEGWHEPPIGQPGRQLEALLDGASQVLLGGRPVAPARLTPGVTLMVVGTREGERIRATLVTDLEGLVLPPAEARALGVDQTGQAEVQLPRREPAPELLGSAICSAQDFDFGTDVDEFQGCWGGPSTSWTWDTPDVRFACGVAGCFGLQRLSFTLAALGWNFAFPFRFSAVAPQPLVYHVPGSVEIGLDPLEATSGDFTFSGGLGVDMGVDTKWCTYFDLYCYDLGTYHLSPFSTVHQATDKPPFTGQSMGVAEVGCPGLTVVPLIPGVLDALSIGMCTDLEFSGAPFDAFVDVGGSSPWASSDVEFDGAPRTLAVRPNSSSVQVEFTGFEYIPSLSLGFYFRLRSLGLKIVESPPLKFMDGPFHAVTTPYPNASYFSETEVLQPTSRQIAIGVQPAPTRLTIVSAPLLAEGTPVRAELVEEYDHSPIRGRPVRLTAVGEGTVIEIAGWTDAYGVVAGVLPNGEYAVTATFDGEDVYRPSTDHQEPVFVYLPSSFVIWGGNAGGVQVGRQYLFWGSQWWKQITGGDFQGNSSFKGYAEPVGPSAWTSPPGNAESAPTALPRLIGAIVSTSIRGRGAQASGDIAYRVILRVESPESYAPNPGHSAAGVMRLRLPDALDEFATHVERSSMR